MLKDIKLSVLSGIMISIGGCAYLSCVAQDIKWLGALLFSAGLYTICLFGFNLYTGKVGYIAYHFKDRKYYGLVLLTLGFNLVSTYLLGILCAYAFPGIKETAQNLYAEKLSSPLPRMFVSGVFCGILMFLAVDSWKKGSRAGVFIYIPAFIYSGFEHSVANSFYNGAANGFLDAFTLKNTLMIASVVLGNALGGMTVPLLSRDFRKNTQDKS